MAKHLNRSQMKAYVKPILADAQVSPKGMTALYCGIPLLLNLALLWIEDSGIFYTFASFFTELLTIILAAGFVMYCMQVLSGQRADYGTLLDGLSYPGKIILLNILINLNVVFWSLFFVIPGIVTAYRYRFALYNLYENPQLGVLEAMALSRRQTRGYKWQLFVLDLSYFGWELLSILPILCASVSLVLSGAATAYDSLMDALAQPAVLILANLWALVVALYYLPNRTCVELLYYGDAKNALIQPITPPDEFSAV